MIRVLVVDDEALIRTGFQHILNSSDDLDVVAAVPGGRAVQAVRELHPEVVLLDIRMPDVDGLTVLAELRRLPALPWWPCSPPSTWTSTWRPPCARGPPVSCSRTPTRNNCRISYGHWRPHGVVLSSRVTRTVVDGYLDNGPREAAVRLVGRLTERERAVLVLITEGLSNTDIGDRMHLSTGTVKDHVSALLTKLEVGSRVQAALLAERAGLLRPSRPVGRGREDG